MRTITNQLDMSHGGIPPVIKLSQYDSDFSLVFELFDSVGTLTIESGTTAEIRGTKVSGTGYSASATINVSTKTVTVTGDKQITAIAGQNIFELMLTKSNKEINSANFIIDVERAAMDEDTVTDESVIRELADFDTQIAEAQAAAERAEAAAERVKQIRFDASNHTIIIGGNT